MKNKHIFIKEDVWQLLKFYAVEHKIDFSGAVKKLLEGVGYDRPK